MKFFLYISQFNHLNLHLKQDLHRKCVPVTVSTIVWKIWKRKMIVTGLEELLNNHEF